MSSSIEKILSNRIHGSTVLFNRFLKYCLTLKDESILEEVKQSAKHLALEFPKMGLFQKFYFDIQQLSVSSEIISYIESVNSKLNLIKTMVNKEAEGFIWKKSTVLTISHSGRVKDVLLFLHQKGHIQKVLCIRSAPKNEGEIFARELQLNHISAIIVDDETYMKKAHSINMVLLGSDLFTSNSFVNKTGSKQLVGWAIKNEFPVIIVGDILRYIPRIELHFTEKDSFERISYSNSLKILCEKGVLSPSEFLNYC